TPPAGFAGQTFFIYDVRDNEGVAARQGVVTLRVTAIGDRPPAAANDSFQTLEEQTLTIDQGQLLSNDSDPDSDTLTAKIVDQPIGGTLSRNSSGAFVYKPAAGFYEGPTRI